MLGEDFPGVLAGALGGDERAFERLYRETHPPLLRYLRVMSADLAEDAASEAWLEVSRGLDGFTGSEPAFRAWIFAIARRKVIDRIRYETRRPSSAWDDLDSIAPLTRDTAEEYAVREGARRAVVNDPSSPRTCDGIIASVKNQLSGLGLNASNVQVKVTQDGFVNSSTCGTTFQASTFGGNSAHIPCRGSFDSTNGLGARSLIVETQYVSSIPAAFPPFPTTLPLSSKAVYRCEFDA